MASNLELILNGIVSHRHQASAPQMKLNDYFEVFVAELLLAETRASYEEVMAGIVGGGGDGGIDALYIYVNGQPLTALDELPETLPMGCRIELYLVQAKYQTSFAEEALRKIESTCDHLLRLDLDLNGFRRLYSRALLDQAGLFRAVYRQAMISFPTLDIKCFYASKGDAARLHPAVRTRAELLQSNLSNKLPDTAASVDFIGAKELVDLAKQGSRDTLQLEVAETAISTERGGYVALVNLPEYHRFLVGAECQLRKWLFDYNVRDYEGPTVQVNQAIRATLGAPREHDDFWWLNNGVSIVADNVTSAGKTLNMQAPRIVNGLQTSMEIFAHFNEAPERSFDDDRKILVRVIQATSDESRDRIIKATNSQSLIPGIALRSTEPLHAQIEDFFAQHNLWYERRQNKYKNEGKPLKRIVTIPSLAEAVLATAYSDPHLGTARLGGRFLREETTYELVFKDSYDLRMYSNAVEIVRLVDDYVDSLSREARADYGKLIYFAATAFAAMMCRRWKPGPIAIANLDLEAVRPGVIEPLFRHLREELDQVMDWSAGRKNQYDLAQEPLLERTRFNLEEAKLIEPRPSK